MALRDNFWGNGIAILSGAFLPFAFAPTKEFWLALICPAILLWLWLDLKPSRAFKLGYLFGLAYFGVGVSWVYVSIHTYGNADAPLAFLITALFVMILALFIGLNGYCLQRFFPHNNLSKLLVVFPASWAIFEAVRSYIFSGFPWLLLGHVMVPSLLSGFAPVLGVYGCTYMMILLSALVLLATVPGLLNHDAGRWREGNFSLIAIAIIFAVGMALSNIHWTHQASKNLSVAMVQGNIPQSLRWDPIEINNILETYQIQSVPYWANVNTIIWPEAAIPLTPEEAKPYLRKITAIAKKNHSGLLLGLPIQEDKFHYYNAAMGLGDVTGVYKKRHLVPFGEYVPFENILRGAIGFFNLPMSSMLSGDSQQPLMTIKNIPIAVLICYEIAYGHIVRQDLPQAQLLVTISDDAWFGNSFAPWQHLQIGQFQAAATQRQLLFVGNNGVTAHIDSNGKLLAALPQFTEAVLSADVTIYGGETPWIIWGDLPLLALMLIALVVVYMRS